MFFKTSTRGEHTRRETQRRNQVLLCKLISVKESNSKFTSMT